MKNVMILGLIVFVDNYSVSMEKEQCNQTFYKYRDLREVDRINDSDYELELKRKNSNQKSKLNELSLLKIMYRFFNGTEEEISKLDKIDPETIIEIPKNHFTTIYVVIKGVSFYRNKNEGDKYDLLIYDVYIRPLYDLAKIPGDDSKWIKEVLDIYEKNGDIIEAFKMVILGVNYPLFKK